MTMAGIFDWLFPPRTEATAIEEVCVRVGVRGHQGEPLVVTKASRCDHVVDSLFDDTRLDGLLRRVELTRESVTFTWDARASKEIRDIARKRLPFILGAPRFVVEDDAQE